MTAKDMPYSGNVATLPDKDTENARNYGGDKETTERKVLIAFADGKFHHAIDARFYMGRSSSASTVYCSVWMHSRDGKRYFAGRGSAGGCGYHKASAAFDDAVTSAGIKLAKNVSGCGDGPMELAMQAIATALGFGDDTPTTIVG